MKRTPLYLTVALAILSTGACATSLTLTTYNIHSGIPDGYNRLNYTQSPRDLHNISDIFTTAGAEIIAMQEVSNQWNRPKRGKPDAQSLNMPQHIATILNMNYAFGSTLDATSGYPENRGYLEWGNVDKWTNNGADHGEYGNAILSKYNFAAPPTIVKLPRGDAEALKNMDEARNAVRVELTDVPGLGPVVIYSSHLQHNNGQTREAQMTELLKTAKADTTTATVFIMGDMNHFPHKGEPDLLGMVKEAGFHDLAAEFATKTGTEPANTMGGGKKAIRIDYIFCSKPLDVSDVQVFDTKVSDHFPLTVRLKLK